HPVAEDAAAHLRRGRARGIGRSEQDVPVEDVAGEDPPDVAGLELEGGKLDRRAEPPDAAAGADPDGDLRLEPRPRPAPDRDASAVGQSTFRVQRADERSLEAEPRQRGGRAEACLPADAAHGGSSYPAASSVPAPLHPHTSRTSSSPVLSKPFQLPRGVKITSPACDRSRPSFV